MRLPDRNSQCGAIRRMQSLTESLVSQCVDEKIKKTLSALAEEFHYSDPVS